MIALLIIDMQIGMFSQETPRYDSERVINNICKMAEKVRDNHGKVIFIQHDGNSEEGYEPNSEEWKIIPQLEIKEEDVIIHKTACDAFYHTDLEKTLTIQGAKDLIITGCATDFCVDTTIRVAASKEYNIYVAKDGHTTADRPSIKADQVISHHNWIWENLILPKKNVKVLMSREIIQILDNQEK